MGREYPAGYEYFRKRLRTAFLNNKEEIDQKKIDELIGRGEFVSKEIEALYMLRKYRTLKKRYYETEQSETYKMQKIESHVDS